MSAYDSKILNIIDVSSIMFLKKTILWGNHYWVAIRNSGT